MPNPEIENPKSGLLAAGDEGFGIGYMAVRYQAKGTVHDTLNLYLIPLFLTPSTRRAGYRVLKSCLKRYCFYIPLHPVKTGVQR